MILLLVIGRFRNPDECAKKQQNHYKIYYFNYRLPSFPRVICYNHYNSLKNKQHPAAGKPNFGKIWKLSKEK